MSSTVGRRQGGSEEACEQQHADDPEAAERAHLEAVGVAGLLGAAAVGEIVQCEVVRAGSQQGSGLELVYGDPPEVPTVRAHSPQKREEPSSR